MEDGGWHRTNSLALSHKILAESEKNFHIDEMIYHIYCHDASKFLQSRNPHG